MSLAAWECVPVVPTTLQFAPSSVAPGLSPGALEEAVSKCTWPPVNSGLGPEALGAAVRWSGSADESGLGPDGGGGERSMSCSIVLPTPSTRVRLLNVPSRFRIPARRRQRERVCGVEVDCRQRTASEKDDRLPGTSGSLPAGETAANAVSISILFRVFFAFFFEIVFWYFGSAHGTSAGAASARWTVMPGRCWAAASLPRGSKASVAPLAGPGNHLTGEISLGIGFEG